ncbi:MAG: TROVE domain-containing protein [Planctomycetales bacterium]|nr:TROVE domain-containing protein [Planctomycetales bacterium]
MANKTLFQSLVGKLLPKTDAKNSHGAPAYALKPKHALAQYAATGCLSTTYYASAEDQLAKVLGLCEAVEPEFIARTALFARERGYMKDLPALLCAVLATKGPGLLAEVFDRVIDDARMLRNFVQIIRSGAAGRKSLGTLPKRLLVQWLEARSDEALFRASVGNAPSLADIVKMTHPKPTSASRQALYAYLIGRPHDAEQLPELVRQYEAFKAGAKAQTPDVPLMMLTALDLNKSQWMDIARHASWQTLRMNLNAFARHGVFDDKRLVQKLAEKLADAKEIERAKVFPYQLLVAYAQTEALVPGVLREALQDAMEIALRNVPRIQGKVYICPDVSGSMRSPATGVRTGATSVVRCIDAAALISAAMLRTNARAEVIPFEQQVVPLTLNARDSVMTNATKLAAIGGGGTNCSAPLALLNKRKAEGDLVIYVSDNESWVDNHGGRGTAMMREWEAFKYRNQDARLVCIDIQPNATTQAVERPDVLNIGGFSDNVFRLIDDFVAGRMNQDHWVGVIEAMRL